MDAETVVLKLQEEITGPASAATAALDQLTAAQMRSATAAARLSAAQSSAASAASRAASAENGVAGSAARAAAAESNAAAAASRAAIADTNASIAALKLASAQAKAAGASTDSGEAAGSAALPLGAMAKATKMLGGEAGASGSKVLRLAKAFMTMGPEIAIAIVALAAVAAAIAAVVGIVAKGITEAGAYRDEFLKLQGAMKGSAAKATEVEDAVSAVSGASALGRDKLLEYGTQLEKAGIHGKTLTHALEAAGIAGAAGGDAIADAFLASVTGAKDASQSVDALSAKMKKQLGGVAAEQAISLSVQMTKLQENIADLFSGADIEPFLKGLHSVLSILDADSGAAKSMKAAITDMVNTAIGGMLRLAIVMVTAYTTIRNNSVAWFAVKAAAYTVLAVFALIAVAIAAVVAGGAVLMAGLAAPIFAVIAVVMALKAAFMAVYNFIAGITWEKVGYAIVAALLLPVTAGRMLGEAIVSAFHAMMAIDWGAVGQAIVGAFASAVAFVANLPATMLSLGVAMIDGLVNGITAGASAVAGALGSVVQGGIKAAKSALGIASPSKVFTAIGENTTDSYAGAVEDGTPDVAAATSGMAKGAAVAAAAVPAPSPSAESGGAMGRAINFYNCVFGGDLTEEKLRVLLVPVLETEARAGG